jgi:hypothetical protein
MDCHDYLSYFVIDMWYNIESWDFLRLLMSHFISHDFNYVATKTKINLGSLWERGLTGVLKKFEFFFFIKI